MDEEPSAPASPAGDPEASEPPEPPAAPQGFDASSVEEPTANDAPPADDVPPADNPQPDGDDPQPDGDEAPLGEDDATSMNDEPPRGRETASDEEPAAGRGASRRLYREPDDRRVAGVCAGLADYVGVEPRFVRMATIVLAVLSPITVIAYGLASLTVPQRPPTVARTRAAGLGGSEGQQGWVLATLGVGVAVGLAVGTWTWWELDVPLAALGLIAVGIWWLFRGRAGPTRSYLSFSVDTTTENDQSVQQGNHFGHDLGASRGRVDAATPDAPRPETEGAGPPSGVPPLPPPEWSGPAPGGRPPGRGRLSPRGWQGGLRTWARRWRPGHLGLLVMALLLIGWGTVWLLRVVDVVTVGPRVAIATGLLLAGLALGVAAWRGRAGLLIPLGFFAALTLAAAEVVDIPLDAGIGERTVAVDRPSQLGERHELLIGDLTLDLRDAPLPPSGTTFVSAGVGAGKLRIRVPVDAEVVVRSDVRVGQVTGDFPPGTNDAGMLVRSTERLAGGSTAGPRLDIGVDVGIGEVEVVRG